MGEVLAISWTESRLELRKVGSEGVWRTDTSPISAFDLIRPSRINRFEQSDCGGKLPEAFSHLLSQIEITTPIWLLLPRDWVMSFEVPVLDLPDEDLKKTHLMWEAQQRLHGDISRFNVLIPANIDTEYTTLQVIHHEIIETFVACTKSGNLEITGISLEPENGGEYSFELPTDFREAIRLDDQTEVAGGSQINIPPAVAIGAGSVLLVAAGYFFILPLFTGNKDVQSDSTGSAVVIEKEKTAEPGIETVEKSTPSIPKNNQTIKPAESSKESPEIQQSVQQQSAHVQHPVSPLSTLARMLPSGASINLAVISPIDLKLEIIGLKNSDSWLRQIRQHEKFRSLQLTGKYSGTQGNAISLRMIQPGWSPGTQRKDVSTFVTLAKAIGMKPMGRIARGSFDKSLQLVDAVWQAPGGFSKVYLAQNSGEWSVTVQ